MALPCVYRLFRLIYAVVVWRAELEIDAVCTEETLEGIRELICQCGGPRVSGPGIIGIGSAKSAPSPTPGLCGFKRLVQ